MIKWCKRAEAELKRVPFFIRKKVRKKAELYVQERGKSVVEVEDLSALKNLFLSGQEMERQIKGYDVSICFGDAGCPNSAASCNMLFKEITLLMEQADILSFLKKSVTSGLKFHHEFKIVLSECPNACSRPQIADIGIIGAVVPQLTDNVCSLCEACVESCRENAVCLNHEGEKPVINFQDCVKCGTCAAACPSGILKKGPTGYRVMLGGRLGRHPRLAMELNGIYTEKQVLSIVKKCVAFYKKHSKNGQRFSHILESLTHLNLENLQ